MKKSIIGIIGGMGVQATAVFYEKIHKHQNITSEQEYIDVLIYSKPSIPDRTDYILGKSSRDPLIGLVDAVKALTLAGAEVLAMPCLTSHYFYDEMAKRSTVSLVDFPTEIAKALKVKKLKKVGIFATDGTLNGGVLENKLSDLKIEIVKLCDSSQKKLVSEIYEVKKGKSLNLDALECLADELMGKGAETIVLGCTELCIDNNISFRSENILDILAKATLREFYA